MFSGWFFDAIHANLNVNNAAKIPDTYTEKNGVKTPTSSLPWNGEPGSTGTLYNPDGSVKQERWYKPNTEPDVDIDYNHGGTGHTFPHGHEYDENGERGDPIPLLIKLLPALKEGAIRVGDAVEARVSPIIIPKPLIDIWMRSMPEYKPKDLVWDFFSTLQVKINNDGSK